MSDLQTQAAALIDNRPLIEAAGNLLVKPENKFKFHEYDQGKEAERLGFRGIRSGNKQAFIVTAEETALELGSPGNPTIESLLWTMDQNVIQEGVWISGQEFSDIKETHASLVLTVMVQVPSGFDAGNARFRSILNMSNRIPGLMSRSVPGKLWIRISRELMNRNFTVLSMGQCVIHTFHDAVPEIGPVSVIIAAGDISIVNEFEPVHSLERAYSGKNRKLSLEASGVVSCADLNCAVCDEKKSCDTIREIISIKKSGTTGA
jgi:CO dehydrogenase/acetyl-CoA synthase beta subunit